jgi:RluA family pseudouridine synthase
VTPSFDTTYPGGRVFRFSGAAFDPLACDNHLLVIAKPAGVLAQADETGDADVITQAKAYLKQRFKKPGEVFVGLMHRLDRPASGVMVLARTSKSAARLTNQFKDHTVTKRYLAVVEGKVDAQGVLKDYLHKNGRVVNVVPKHVRSAKYAELSYKRLAFVGGLSLVIINLKTGRPHQIRVQFSSRGHALLGDMRYRASREFDGKNLALHSHFLAVDHPTKKERLGWLLEPPPTWSEFTPFAKALKHGFGEARETLMG